MDVLISHLDRHGIVRAQSGGCALPVAPISTENKTDRTPAATERDMDGPPRWHATRSTRTAGALPVPAICLPAARRFMLPSRNAVFFLFFSKTNLR